MSYKQLEDKLGPVEEESIRATLRAWHSAKHWEEPTPLSVERIHKYIRQLEQAKKSEKNA